MLRCLSISCANGDWLANASVVHLLLRIAINRIGSFRTLQAVIMSADSRAVWHSTTILSVRRGSTVAIGGDGQVTYNTQIMKSDTRKIRRLHDDNVLVGFAGSTADAFTLIERFEKRLKDFPDNLQRAATELARDWRNDRNLKKLEAMLIVVDTRHSLLVTGQGDVLQTPDDILGIGTGGPYAIAAARALLRHSTMSASEIVREALLIASGIDVYTNENVIVEELTCVS